MGQPIPKGLSDDKAMRMLAAFRLGKTMRGFTVKRGRFEAYCDAHPEYGAEALALLQSNRLAGNQRKADYFRSKTHCKSGHTLADARVYMYKGYRTRACIHCNAIHDKTPRAVAPEVIEKAKAALKSGVPRSAKYALAGRLAAGK